MELFGCESARFVSYRTDMRPQALTLAVHAWSVFRIFKIERKIYGTEDMDFLESCFHKLLLNFTWWVNRKDADGNNLFEGGFLGLDNIGLFNRSDPLPIGGSLEQADSTGWMGFY